MRTGPTNPVLMNLIEELKEKAREHDSSIWRRVAYDLEKPSRNRRVVNLSRINRYSSENEVVVVPGKVLSSGELDHSVTVAAFDFSDSAVSKISKIGKVMKISELIQESPKGKKIRIIG